MTIDVCFQLRREQFSLDVDVQLADDAVTAIYGPSGSGKTTLLRAIAGLDRHVGRLTLQSEVWQNETLFVPTHKRSLAYVFQEASLFEHLTVQGNLDYASRRNNANEKRIDFSLSNFIELLNIGDLLKRRPNGLSGGERQRVAIARALAAYPNLLLMDEPLASLDQSHKQEILPYLVLLHQQLSMPILYVSHAIEEISQLADYMMLIEPNGQTVVDRTQNVVTRLDLSIASAASAGAVVSATISAHDTDYGLTYLDFAGNQLTLVTQAAIAGLSVGSRIRLHIAARDVSITLEKPQYTSILNVFEALVDDLVCSDNALVTVRLLLDEVPLLARITQKSAGQLKLKKGKRVYIQAKSVALLG